MLIKLIIILLSLNQPKLFGVMGAMDVELTLIKEDMTVEHVDTVAERVFSAGKLHDISCVCVKAGIGKVNAALTAEILIMEYNVDAVIFTGVAGGINPKLHIGDIVISERVLHHDYGQIIPDKFIPWDTLGFLADSYLVAVAQNAASNVKFDQVPPEISKKKDHLPEIVIGRVATGDQFIASEKKRKWLEETLHADCVEMEGAAVAQVCVINDIPFVIVRCLSDLANEKADIDFETFVNYAAKNSSLIVKKIFKLFGK
jgi:adenosylhomocysteine nucleosidase